MRAVTRFAGFMALVYAGVAAAAAPAAASPTWLVASSSPPTVCAACHGANGTSTASANPHLAGQGADYIASQLAAFKSGARPNPIMQGMAAATLAEDMIAVGAYYQSQKPVEGLARDKALADRGQRLACRHQGDRGSGMRRAATVLRAPASPRSIRALRGSTPS
jgi:cytochrome c553